MSIFKYIADHEIPKDMPSFFPRRIMDERSLDGVFEKAFNESRENLQGGIKEILLVPPESFSDAKVVNANEETQLDRIEKKLDALNQKIDNIFGSQVLINGKFTQL